MKKKKIALLQSVVAVVLSAAIFVGSTFAYFTDSVSSNPNIIQGGNLDIGLEWTTDLGINAWYDTEDVTAPPIFTYNNWEPGYTEVRYFKVENKGKLAFKYALNLVPNGQVSELADVIDVYLVENPTANITGREALAGMTPVCTLREAINGTASALGVLLPEGADTESGKYYAGDIVVGVALKMRESAGNQYQNMSIGNTFSVQLVATQYNWEEDAFGPDYDEAAFFPEVYLPVNLIIDITGKVENGLLTEDITVEGRDGIRVTVKEGTKVEEGAAQLTPSISTKGDSDSNVKLEDTEEMKAYDVHVGGIHKDNTVPVIVDMGKAMPTGLNIGNYDLYHVEDGTDKLMTSDANLDTHNDFAYDPATGNLTVAMATFSEVAVVADTVNAWEGEFDYSWYTGAVALAEGEAVADYIIANADQLAAFGAIVGGMDGQTQDSFKDKTVKLTADINLGDDEEHNNANIIFYPIGYYNSTGSYTKSSGGSVTSDVNSFEGTFDGNGHTIKNFYQNTWEMFGDYNNGYSGTPNHYKDAMGLFGYVKGGTVKNLTIDNFYSEGEFAPTGCVAAYAANATFENIAITNSHPATYNTSVAAVVGRDGKNGLNNNEGYNLIFRNITVDSTNTVSALWGSWDVGAAGLLGYLGPESKVLMENCHVSATIDVYNDVCGNYQYYWYRYCGMMIGTVDKTKADGSLDLSNITATKCTVNFGDRHEYYYCEFVENTKASYTHDYQFSRVDNADIVGKGESATCQNHNHEEHGYETVNGGSVLVEDKQAVYIPFRQLFGGYGWGVDGVDQNEYPEIQISTDTTSVEKFIEKNELPEIEENKPITIGSLFYVINGTPKVDVDNVQVTVSPVADENGKLSNVSATYTPDTTDWTQGKLIFIGTGAATITITDYYFCIPTTITVNVTERKAAEKFETKFTGNFLYRVGNQNTVSIGSLFKAKDGATINGSGVVVTIDKVDENIKVGGTFTKSTTENWGDGTIQFAGTGVVKVTITDNDYCIATELTLEVVDAVNVTTATSATANNVVLLNDCGFSSLEVSGGYTLYGNGFTMTCDSDSAALDMGYSFVTLNNGTLDNVQIVCPNFDYAVLYKSNMTEDGNRKVTTDKTRYFNVKSGVMASGNSQILNSRISGGRAAVNVTGGNVVIDNSRVELGAVASVLVGAANSLTLRDVTLVQKPTASTYNSNKKLMGFSVLFICDANGDAAPVTLEGTLVQNAWIDENDKQYVPSAGQSIVSTVLAKTEYLHDIDGDGTKESLNLGFAYMPESLTSAVNATTITDNRTNKETVPYDYADVSILNGKTYVYSYKNANGTADSFKTESEYAPSEQSDIITVSYSDTADGLTTGKSYGTDGWVYELNVDLDKLSGYAFDFSKLSMSVNGTTVTDYKVNGSDKPTSPVAVTAGGTTYTLTATVNGKEYTATYKVTGTETSKESPSKISGPTTAGFGVAKSYGGDWSGAADVLTGVKIRYWSVAENNYKEFDFSNFTVPGNAGKLNGTNNYWEYTHDNNDFTLKVTNTIAIHSGKSVYGMPIRGTDGKLYFTISSTNGYVGSGTTSRSVTMQYEFTDNNGGEKLTFTHTFNISYNKDDQYSYSDLSGSGKLTKLESSSSGGGTCLAAGTMITMADGTKRAVEDLRKGDSVLSFDHTTGKITENEVIIVVRTSSSFYENAFIFDDGTELVTINEHGIYDLNLNKYVNIDRENAGEFIGHRFVSVDEKGNIGVKKLIRVTSEYKSGYKYDIVTEGTLNYVAEDTLSVTHVLVDIINTFDFTPEMTFDVAKMQADIEKYGLYSYDEWKEYCDISVYEEYNIPVMKVGVLKGLYTKDYIIHLINEYVLNENNQIL